MDHSTAPYYPAHGASVRQITCGGSSGMDRLQQPVRLTQGLADRIVALARAPRRMHDEVGHVGQFAAR